MNISNTFKALDVCIKSMSFLFVQRKSEQSPGVHRRTGEKRAPSKSLSDGGRGAAGEGAAAEATRSDEEMAPQVGDVIMSMI